MKKLFNEDKGEKYTYEAVEIDKLAEAAIKPIFTMAKERGYAIRDVQYIIQAALFGVAMATLLGWDEPEKPLNIEK